MAASGTSFKNNLEKKEELETQLSSSTAQECEDDEAPIIFQDTNNIELDEFDFNEHIQSEYARLDDNIHEHLVEIKNETRPAIDHSLSDILTLKQQIQKCKMPLKKEIDLISWDRLSRSGANYLLVYGGLSSIASMVGAPVSLGAYDNTHSEIAADIFIGFFANLCLAFPAIVTGLLLKGFPQQPTCAYPFPIKRNAIYPALDTLLTADEINETATVINTINIHFFRIQIAEDEDGRKILCKLNQAEKCITQIELKKKAADKATGIEVLKVFKNLNRNGFFAHNSNSDTPDPIRRTTLEYIIGEESVIDSLVPSRKKYGLC